MWSWRKIQTERLSHWMSGDSCVSKWTALQRFGDSAQRILFVPSRCQCLVLTRDQAHLLLGSRPLAVRLICIVLSVQSRFVKASAGSQWLPPSETRSGNSPKHRVDTISFIIHTCSSYAVAQPHEHTEHWTLNRPIIIHNLSLSRPFSRSTASHIRETPHVSGFLFVGVPFSTLTVRMPVGQCRQVEGTCPLTRASRRTTPMPRPVFCSFSTSAAIFFFLRKVFSWKCGQRGQTRTLGGLWPRPAARIPREDPEK